MNILVTGGCGYIGSHTVLQLLEQGHAVTVFDNFCNSSPVALQRVAKLAGSSPILVEGDIRNSDTLAKVFLLNSFDAVVHFAGLKAVGESVLQPLTYYDNNVKGTLTLLECMNTASVRRLVFSSSATVYGDPQSLPITEDAPLGATNPYGQTKLIVENILADLYASDPTWQIARLRYFNPVGNHPSGLIGEDPNDVPNNLMPYIAQVASGLRDCLSVYGNDYNTIDGTGVRDFIHVMDLAGGHLKALEYLASRRSGDLLTLNLGTGSGLSVLQLIAAFERNSGVRVPYKVVDRRPGDVASCYADATAAQRVLGWFATRTVDEMCADTWCWQSQNPRGFKAY